uniref:60-kDa chaperonin n=1 Tax=Eustigmatophyceae sp. Mont 10/10-1w TaxID=2506145 RepID=A0A3R5V1X7_9STRA|nr:60-kDa chaperonin [Eustigmatophyceae sp. Mont 10/10-1w]QAA11755.1 60-kDa chaperonin [Eustigmatophyceae sp. Mont 10/10-1w]
MKSYLAGKVIQFNEVQNHLIDGIKLIYRLINETYGPIGKNILIDSTKTTNLELCNKGSRVVSQLKTRDKNKNLVILLLQDSFQKINNVSGDGSKTFFLITSSVILNGFKHIANRVDTSQINIGIQQTLDYSLILLSEKAEPIQNKDVWYKTISQFMPNEDNINSMIKQIFENIGKAGRIKLDLTPGYRTSVEIEHGLQINRGYFSPYFVTDSNKMLIEFQNPYILISKQKISLEESQLVRILELLIHTKRPLIIFSPEIEEEALSTLILNKINGIIDLAYVKIPILFGSDRNTLEDLSVYTGAKIISNYTQWKLFTLNNLGEAKRVLITKTKTAIWSDNPINNKLINERSKFIKNQLISTNSIYENEKLEDRYKNFNTSNAILKIGGVTDLETEELKSRVENGLVQLKGCLYDGILPGGVINYALINEEVENWSRANLYGEGLIGSKLVINSFLKPFQALLNQERLRKGLFSNVSSDDKSNEIYRQKIIDYQSVKKSINEFITEKNNIESFKNIKIQIQTTSSLSQSILSIGHFII